MGVGRDPCRFPVTEITDGIGAIAHHADISFNPAFVNARLEQHDVVFVIFHEQNDTVV